MFIIESLESFRGLSATFLFKDQIKLKSMLKLVSLSYRATYIYEADEAQI